MCELFLPGLLWFLKKINFSRFFLSLSLLLCTLFLSFSLSFFVYSLSLVSFFLCPLYRKREAALVALYRGVEHGVFATPKMGAKLFSLGRSIA